MANNHDSDEPPPGNPKLTLRLDPATIRALEHLNGYVPCGDLPSIARYCLLRGIEQLRFQQSVRDQADILGVFTGAFTEAFEVMGKVMEAAGKDLEQPEIPAMAKQLEQRVRNGAGLSSTGVSAGIPARPPVRSKKRGKGKDAV